jgi:hypothetical protein
MWTTVPAVVLVILAITIVLACLATIILVGRKNGRTKVRVTLFGQGFTYTVEHSEGTESEEVANATEEAASLSESAVKKRSLKRRNDPLRRTTEKGP